MNTREMDDTNEHRQEAETLSQISHWLDETRDRSTLHANEEEKHPELLSNHLLNKQNVLQPLEQV